MKELCRRDEVYFVNKKKKGEVVLIEISPKFFSTWDYSKVQYE